MTDTTTNGRSLGTLIEAGQTHLQRYGAAFLVGLGHCATHWIAAVFYVLLPYLTRDLGINYVQAGLFVAVFQVSSFLANFGSGAVVDLGGRRVRYQIISLLLGAVALAGFSLTASYLVLCLLVAVIGVSNNLWHPAAISFLSGRYPEQRGYTLSIHALGASLGDAVAPLAAGFLLLTLSWQSTAFWSTLPVFVLVLVFLRYLLPQDSVVADRSAQGLSFSAYARALKMMIKRRDILGLCLMSGFRSAAQVGLLMFLPLYLVNELQVSPVMMGGVIMVMHFAGLVASPLAGIISDRRGRRPVVLAGLSASTVVIIALTLVDNMVLYVTAVAVLGFVLYAVRPVVHSWMMDLTPTEMGGSATSLLFGTQAALSALMPLVGGIVADLWGLAQVFYLIALMMLLANALVFLLPGEARHGDQL